MHRAVVHRRRARRRGVVRPAGRAPGTGIARGRRAALPAPAGSAPGRRSPWNMARNSATSRRHAPKRRRSAPGRAPALRRELLEQRAHAEVRRVVRVRGRQEPAVLRVQQEDEPEDRGEQAAVEVLRPRARRPRARPVLSRSAASSKPRSRTPSASKARPRARPRRLPAAPCCPRGRADPCRAPECTRARRALLQVLPGRGLQGLILAANARVTAGLALIASLPAREVRVRLDRYPMRAAPEIHGNVAMSAIEYSSARYSDSARRPSSTL